DEASGPNVQPHPGAESHPACKNRKRHPPPRESLQGGKDRLFFFFLTILERSESCFRNYFQLNSGKVIAVGPGSRDKDGKLIPVSVKEGDTVLLPEYGGTQVKLGEKEYHLFRDEDVLGTLHED
ncbi:unnamed protein product, partial [Brassica oleracea]